MMRYGIVIGCLFALGFVLFTTAQDLPDARVVPMDNRLRLHITPALDSETTAFLDPETPLKLLGKTRDSQWLQVQAADGANGWVVVQFVEIYISLDAIPITTDMRALSAGGYSLTSAVARNVRFIYELGQLLGNQSNVFSKVGDSITVASHMLQPISSGFYNLGDYQYLQSVIDHFMSGKARDGDPFSNVSVAAGVGWTSAAVIDPQYADPNWCDRGEIPLTCEYRLSRPSIALIMFGTNDTAHLTPATYEYNLSQIVEISVEKGVIPVLSTIPVRQGYEDESARLNEMVIKVSRQYDIPLWDYGAAMQSAPNLGLDIDGVHPSIPANGFKGAADFRASNLYSGYVIRNLTALQMLDMIWEAVNQPGL